MPIVSTTHSSTSICADGTQRFHEFASFCGRSQRLWPWAEMGERLVTLRPFVNRSRPNSVNPANIGGCRWGVESRKCETSIGSSFLVSSTTTSSTRLKHKTSINLSTTSQPDSRKLSSCKLNTRKLDTHRLDVKLEQKTSSLLQQSFSWTLSTICSGILVYSAPASALYPEIRSPWLISWFRLSPVAHLVLGTRTFIRGICPCYRRWVFWWIKAASRSLDSPESSTVINEGIARFEVTALVKIRWLVIFEMRGWTLGNGIYTNTACSTRKEVSEENFLYAKPHERAFQPPSLIAAWCICRRIGGAECSMQ